MSTSSAINPHKRPRIRDHGARTGTAHDMSFVNSTMTQFLGGKRKSWMTGQQCEGRRSSQHEAIPQSQKTISPLPTAFPLAQVHPATVIPSEAVNSTRVQAVSISVQPRAVQAVAQEQRAGLRKNCTMVLDPSLPSPSPSDDAHQVPDVMHVDQHQVTRPELVNPIPGQETLEQPTGAGAVPHLSENTEILRSLAEKYGGIDELQRRLEATERSAVRIGATVVDTPRTMPISRDGTPYALTRTGSTTSINPGPVSPIVISNAVATSSFNARANAHPPSVDILASGLQFLLPVVSSQIESARRSQTSGLTGPLEESRLRLLQSACESGDVFYLVLHQIHCLSSTPDFLAGYFGFNEYHISGLRVVEELILPNKGLMNESLTWLSAFPQSFGSLLDHSSIYQSAYSDVGHCLELLAHRWFRFKGACVARKSPPLVDYINSELGVKSTVLQQVIFTALHRLLWTGSHDVCSAKSGNLFKDNQRMSQHWHLRHIGGNPPSKEEMTSYYQRLVAEYQHLQNCHMEHINEGLASASEARQPPSTMMPPLAHNLTSSSHQSRPRPAPILPSSRWSSSGLVTPVQSPVPASPTSNTSLPPNRQPRHRIDHPQQSYTPTATGTDQARTLVRTLLPPPLTAILRTQPNLDYYNPPRRSSLLPPVGFSLQHNGQPLDNTALHQAHLRDPEFSIHGAGHDPNTNTYFQYFQELAAAAIRIRPQDRNVYFNFPVSAKMLATIPKHEPQPQGAPSVRIVHNNSHSFRLRCIKIAHPNKQFKIPWLGEETSWPSNAVFVCNNTHLELRRKAHYGRDLPVDITSLIKEGNNNLHIALLRVGPLAIDADPTYAIAVEVIEIGNLGTVKQYVRHDENTMIERIKMRLNPTDSDVEVLNSDITIEVIDPYSSSLIRTPVRGADCRHYECFDLDNFLETRSGSLKGPPCQPEQFKCPICNGDARPQSLLIDEWFCKMLEEIRRQDRLDARSIVMDRNGAWRIREEEAEGESGDGTGRRKQSSTIPARSSTAPRVIESEIIEID